VLAVKGCEGLIFTGPKEERKNGLLLRKNLLYILSQP
jgi:hypothetical protein